MNKLNKNLLIAGALTLVFACNNKDTEMKADTSIGFDISQIDTSIKPCEDFEKYAVGNWLKNNPVPESESSWSSFNIVRDENEKKLRAIVAAAAVANAQKNTPLQQVGDFYTSAMDSNKVNELGVKPILPYLSEIDKVSNIQELLEMMARLRKLGSASIFTTYVGIDSKNSTEYILNLVQGGLGLPDKDYYFPKDERGKSILEAYNKHIATLFELVGDTKEVAIEKASSIIALETALASNSMDRVERRDPLKTYNKMTISDLQTLCDAFDWISFLEKESFDVTVEDELVVAQIDFISKLSNALNTIPLETWRNYLKWQFINDMSNNLSIDFEKANFSFYATILSGVKVMKPRWKRALAKSNTYVGEQLGRIFVEKHFPKESKQKILSLIGNISATFKERVRKLDWMEDATKEQALYKLEKFTYKIGYPDKWKDYSSVDINANTLLENTLKMNTFKYMLNVNKLGKPIDKTEWGMNPQVTNAYYNPPLNEIAFPAAILQFPFFSPEADDAINYGGIGAVIGHEFSHGFDDQGSKFDGDGNLKNWWTEEDKENFKKKTAVLVEQFNDYVVAEGNHVNGSLTLGENIADFAGLTLAYYALEKAMEGKEDPMIDGFTYQQRFFLGWAQVWHSNMKDEAIINLVKTNPHSPTRFRIIGPLTNMPEFYNAFGCSEGNMFAPDSLRVKIW